MQIEYVKPTKNISVGIYGWRKRCLYGLIIVLTFVVFINICLTFWLSVALGLHWGSIGPISIFKNHVIFRSPVVLKDGLIASKIFSGDQSFSIQSDKSVHIQSGSKTKHSALTIDKQGIHANCEQFQINDRTGSKLVAIDSSQIQVYTDDLSIVSEQKRLELPHLMTNSISSDKNLSLSATDGRLMLTSNSDIDISARQTLDLVANDIIIKSHTIRLQNEHIYFEKLRFFDRAKGPVVGRSSQSYSVCICENGLVFAAIDCRQHTFDCHNNNNKKTMGELIEIQEFEASEDRIWCVSWNPTGTLLASCGSDKIIRLWGREGERNWVCKSSISDGHTRSIRSVAWSLCGNRLASAGFDAKVTIWERDGQDFVIQTILEGHENEVKDIAFSRSGLYLATCGRDKSVWIWEYNEDENDFACAAVLTTHTQDVKHLKWHPQKDVLASCSYDDTIKMFIEDNDDWSCACSLDSHTSTVWSCDFDATGKRLVSCSDDKTVKIWQAYEKNNREGIRSSNGIYPVWKCVCTISGYHTQTIYDVKWCPLTGLIATASGDNGIRIFREEESKQADAPPSFSLIASNTTAHLQDVNRISFHPKEPGLLASCSDDGTIKLWRIEIKSS
ncbi:unnamed protein product [Adineta steineri]|uniref:Probable cytosolic iron-sulfur protein assembly protein CIAO1 homolog n=1 Tax=Adineta steineri TaxID=433720 RepID=A0A815GQ82_9BILA|nr:unnamed protein product [Adineta steineri]CAF1386445.1 unnamed protein product [Adineta steineri]CAF1593248.1 unnamed protein product [Adineta steineri]CAF3881416.1 unnamed protein product [Adineta steineri]